MSEITPAGELFGERLREIRKKRGVTQVELADLTGLPQSHVSAMERGAILPNLLTLLRLAKALGCKTSELVSTFDKQDLSVILPN